MISLPFILIFLSLVVTALTVRAFIFRRRDRRAGAVRQRLTDLKPPPEEATLARSLKKDSPLSSIPFFQRLLSHLPSAGDFQLLILQAGNPFNLNTFLLLSVNLAAAGLAIGLILGIPILSILLALMGASLPLMWLRFMRRRRLAAFEEQFPEGLELIARALRAGHSFSSALDMAAEELEEPISGELAKTLDDYSFGKPLDDALAGLVGRVGLQDVKFFVTAVNMQRGTGGNLTEILDSICYIIRERFKLQRQIKAITAEGRLSGIILSLLAPALLVVLLIISPGYVSILFKEPLGRTLLLVALTFEVMGVLFIRRLVHMKV